MEQSSGPVIPRVDWRSKRMQNKNSRERVNTENTESQMQV